jgi:DNA mismatch repair protein MutS
MSFFSTLSDKDILDEIRGLDISSMTPIDALNQLDAIQKKVKNRW